MTNPDSILKSRDFANKGLSSQSYSFSSSHVWMWELDQKESWAPKNWCLPTVVLGKTLRVPWTARKSNQSILKEISPEYSLEGLMLKLKLQYFGHLMWRADSFAGKDWRQEEKGVTEDEMVGWHHWQWTWVWASSGSWWWTGKSRLLKSTGLQRIRHDWVTELNWTSFIFLGSFSQYKSQTHLFWKQSKTEISLDIEHH